MVLMGTSLSFKLCFFTSPIISEITPKPLECISKTSAAFLSKDLITTIESSTQIPIISMLSDSLSDFQFF